MSSGKLVAYVSPALLALLLGWATVAQAQEFEISGRVIDAETGAPLPGANVFLANSTIGAATNAGGRYVLKPIPAGPSEMVASMIGYEPKRVEISDHEELSGESIDFRLQPARYELGGVEVAGKRPRAWRRNFERFRKEFLGDSRNARETEILNPYVLDFETESGPLVARAAEPLIVENRGLGFQITFVLSDFRLDMEHQRLQYAGYPFFQELEPTSDDEAEQWEQNRLSAYSGSLQHLLWSMIHDRVEKEGFRLRIDDRINAPASQEIPDFAMTAARDLISPTASSDVYSIDFSDYLHVTYEARNRRFRLWSREPSRQVSWLRSRLPGRIYEDGSLYPPSPLVVAGYMTTRRMADRLPNEVIHRLQRGEAASAAVSMAEPENEPPVTYESGLPQEPFVHPAENAALESVAAAMQHEKWSEAMKELKQFLSRNPDDLEARYYGVIVHREIAKFRTLTEFQHLRQGIADARFVIARDSAYRDVLYQYALYSRVPSGKTDLRKQNVSYADAIRLGHAQVRLRPDVPDHQFHLYTLYRRFINHTRTEKALSWLEAHPSDFAEYFRAEVLRRADRLDVAGMILEKLLEHSLEIPRQPILLARARIFYALDQPELAESYVRQAISEIERPLHAAFVFEDFKYVGSEDEVDSYRRMAAAEDYRSFFEAFWAKRDPMPAYVYNVRLAEHYRRLGVAEQDFAYDGFRFWMSNPDKSGELSFPSAYALNDEFNDKGLVYIRLGDPTERIVTLEGEPGGLNSSLGLPGQRSVFLPKDQSYRANWVPNESWRYADLGMDFHFVIDQDAVGENWRLTPALTNYQMMRDRMTWGGVYVQMARAAETADEFSPTKKTSPAENWSNPSELYEDKNSEPASLSSAAIIDISSGRAEMAQRSREHVQRGLTTDRHTWQGDVERLDFPYFLAAFRGESGRTNLHLYYALPAGELAKQASSVEVGVAIHDASWASRGKERQAIDLPTRPQGPSAVVQSVQLSLPPDNYHVALHARALETPLFGAYKTRKHLPDFSAPVLAVSDLLLAYDIATPEAAEPTSFSDLRIVANPFLRFSQDQPVHVYFEVYHLTFGENDLTDYSIEYVLDTAEDAARPRRRLDRGRLPSISIKTNETGRTIFPIEYAEIDVGSVRKGRYILTVKITDNNSNQSASKQIPIELY